MAEGWAKALKPDDIDVWSAGIERHGMNALAIQAMAEAGIDISGQSSKTLDDLESLDFDYVITLCGHAHETCPNFPGQTQVIHRGFDDPPALARDAKDEEEALRHYRRVRDEIKDFVQSLPDSLPAQSDGPDLSVKI
jgi:arsenate reductase